MATEATQAQSASAAASEGKPSQYWCNFCDFKTDDLKEYMSHSCKDVLAARGVAVQPTGRNECS